MKYIDAEKLKQHYAWWRENPTMREIADMFDAIVDAQPEVHCNPEGGDKDDTLREQSV